MRKATMIILLMLLHLQVTVAAPYVGSHIRTYTTEHPLVYEDGWEKWPYAFINDDGEPDGYNVELVHKIMKRLDIPYTVMLRSQADVHEDLKTNRADLSFGVKAGYNESYGHFGEVTVAHFDNALIQPRVDSVGPYKLHDLRDIPFSVKADSRAYHYVMDNGFSDSLVTTVDNMEEEVLRIATENKGAVLWNAMMLKWMVNKYHLDDLAVSSVDIPSGSYRFMSGDPILLHKLDSVCMLMQKEGELNRMMTRWMYPERKTEDNTYIYIVLSIAIVMVVTIVLFYGLRYYRKYYSRNSLQDVNSQMGLVLNANHMQVWVYFPLTRRYAWMTHDGRVNEEYTSFDFSQFYPDQDFNIIHNQVMEFLSRDMGPVVKTLRSHSLNRPGKVLDVEVHMQVLKDDYGKIYLICGVQHDITDSKAHLDRMRLLHERHKVAFNIALGAILRFDGEGTLIDINDRCCVKMGIRNKQNVLAQHFNFRDFGVFKDFDFETMPDDVRFSAFIKNAAMSYYAPIARFDSFNPDPEKHPGVYTQGEIENDMHKVPETGYYYIHLIKSHDNEGKLISVMMFMLDITENVHEQKALRRMQRHADQLVIDKERYKNRRDYTLKSNNIMMFRYRPDRKTLYVFNQQGGKPQELPQLRVLELVDAKDMKRVFRAFHKVDACERGDIHVNVATLLRNERGEQVHYSLDAHPVYDSDGRVESYFGICRDVTHQLLIQQNLRHETQRAREAEHLKQTFLRNMSYSIRQPLVAMRQSIEKLAAPDTPQTEQMLLKNITNNTQRLITLSDDTLLLSRIEAGLFHPAVQELDLVQLYKTTVEDVLKDYRTDTVIYNIDSTYDTLILQHDPAILSRILREAVTLSARYTQYGTLNVRYMYRKGTLTLAVEDTGHGIPPTVLANIFEPHIGGTYNADVQNLKVSGLEMPICKALLDMLGGTIEIDSDPGKGTSIYIVIPVKEQ